MQGAGEMGGGGGRGVCVHVRAREGQRERERERLRKGGTCVCVRFSKQHNNNMNTYGYILCEHSAPSCLGIGQKTLSKYTRSEPVQQFEVQVILDTL